MPTKGWAYYSSAADDEITIRENHAAYHRLVHHITSPSPVLIEFMQDLVPSSSTP
jgi:hypothetical protein